MEQQHYTVDFNFTHTAPPGGGRGVHYTIAPHFHFTPVDNAKIDRILELLSGGATAAELDLIKQELAQNSAKLQGLQPPPPTPGG